MHVAVVSFVVAEAVVEYNAVAITVAVTVDVSAAALFYFFSHLFNIYLRMNRIGLCCFLYFNKTVLNSLQLSIFNSLFVLATNHYYCLILYVLFNFRLFKDILKPKEIFNQAVFQNGHPTEALFPDGCKI